MIEIKDIISLTVGTVIGLLAGIGIYYWPLGQFLNECKALCNLTRKRYCAGDDVTVRAGVDLKPLLQGNTKTTVRDVVLKVWHDEGVGWYHTRSGWKRARILHVYFPLEQISPVYRVCHFELVSYHKHGQGR